MDHPSEKRQRGGNFTLGLDESFIFLEGLGSQEDVSPLDAETKEQVLYDPRFIQFIRKGNLRNPRISLLGIEKSDVIRMLLEQGYFLGLPHLSPETKEQVLHDPKIIELFQKGSISDGQLKALGILKQEIPNFQRQWSSPRAANKSIVLDAWKNGILTTNEARGLSHLDLVGPLKLSPPGSLNFNSVNQVLMLPNEMLLMILEVLMKISPGTLLRSVPFVCKKLMWLCAGVRGKFDFEDWDYERLSSLVFGLESSIFFPKTSVIFPKDVTYMQLGGLKLKVLPRSIAMWNKITYMNVICNKLTVLPAEIGQLTALTNLYVSDNQLTALPDSINGLTALTTLNVSNNKLTALPDSIGRLTALTFLDVRYNQLTALPNLINGLTALSYLDVSHNKLTELPDSISGLTALTSLNISNNQLTGLPDSISGLTALTTLRVSDNQLTELPDSIGGLTALTILNVSDNQLTALPNSIGGLTALERLNVSNNQLPALFEGIGGLTALWELAASNNKLTALPEGICDLTALLYLYLDPNPSLKIFPEGFGKWRQRLMRDD